MTTLYTKYNNPAPATQRIDAITGGELFLSYGTVIAKRINGKVTLDRVYWEYSRTTGYYRNQFLGEGIADTRKKIASGLYNLSNLN